MYESFKLAITTLVLPPGGPILLVVLGVLVWRQYPRGARAISAVGAISLWLLSLPVVSTALVLALGGGQAVDLVAAKQADAIVILSGGVRRQAPEYGGDTLGRLSLERVRYGAYLARQTDLPVLVTGGAPGDGSRAEAELMRDALDLEYGVRVRWTEASSRNTRENASNSAKLLAAEGKQRIVLVMHSFDVRRATTLFESAGLDVIAAPTLVPSSYGPGIGDFMPSAIALHTSQLCLYEILAISRDAAVRWLP